MYAILLVAQLKKGNGMKAMNDYKNMVVVMTTQGIEIKAALDASEIVIFGIQEKQEVKPSGETFTNVEPKAVRKSSKKYVDQTIMAERIGISTRSFNRMLNEKGYLKRIPLLNKPLSSPELKNVSTYVMTEKGEKLGISYVHSNYADGTPAVYRFKWDDSILRELMR